MKKCVIIAGAPENSIEYYKEYLNDRYIICADSGYKKCIELNITPDLIIGDFDSSEKPKINCEIITLNVKKDDTDTLHCAEVACERGYNDIIILGGIGSRVDHTYSNILTLNYCFQKGALCALIDLKNRVRIFEKHIKIEKKNYKYFSVFPLFEECKNVTITGAEYCVNKIDILPSDTFTQSNSFIDDVEISLDRGKLLLIESND